MVVSVTAIHMLKLMYAKMISKVSANITEIYRKIIDIIE